MSRQMIKKWWENVYNCPYLILVMVSSVIAMLSFDEIGIRIIDKSMAPERTVAVVKDVVRAEENPSADGIPIVLEADRNIEEKEAGMQTGAPENAQEDLENAGTRKEEINSAENIEKLNNDTEELEMQDIMGEMEKGVTKFIPYEPLETESRYYSDAGKIALTTEYPYTLENDSYFNDAVFLGDSRTLGIFDYVGLDGADFFCDNGMTIFKLLEDDGVTEQRTGKKVDLKQILQERHYGKVYIMLGINELGYGNTTMYLKQYLSVVNRIREWQPEAVIFIMANLHISKEKNNMETEFNNININDKNVASARLANGTDVFYLDSNPLFTDSEGFMQPELTFDGVHLYAKHYDMWRQFLMEHGVERGNPPAGNAAGSVSDAGMMQEGAE